MTYIMRQLPLPFSRRSSWPSFSIIGSFWLAAWLPASQNPGLKIFVINMDFNMGFCFVIQGPAYMGYHWFYVIYFCRLQGFAMRKTLCLVSLVLRFLGILGIYVYQELRYEPWETFHQNCARGCTGGKDILIPTNQRSDLRSFSMPYNRISAINLELQNYPLLEVGRIMW